MKAGFTLVQLIAVLSNIGGSKNLAALQGLLVKDANDITSLAQLREASFTPEQLIAVLNNIGGSKNLAALQGLLVKDANDITPLAQLIKAHFTPKKLIAVLSHDGGSKNIVSLKGLAQCNLQPEWISFIYSLANQNARSARLNLLTALLKIEAIHKLCVNNSVLIDDFCSILSRKKAKEFKAINIKTPKEFTDFLQENSSLTRKRKRSAAARSQPLHKRQRTLSTNPAETVPQITSTTASFSSPMDIDDIIPLTPLASPTATSYNKGVLSFLEQPLEVTEFAKLLAGLENEPSLLDNMVSSPSLAHKRPRSSALSATVPNPKKRRVSSSASLDYLYQELTALIHSGKPQSNIDSVKVGIISLKKKTEIGIALQKVRKNDSYLLTIINKDYAQQWCNTYRPLTLLVESHGEEPQVNPSPIEVIEEIHSSQEISSPVILPATTSVIKHHSAQNPYSFFSAVQKPRATPLSTTNNSEPFIPSADLELARTSNYTG